MVVSRFQSQLRSLARLIFSLLSSFFFRYHAFSLGGSAVLISFFVKPSQDGLLIAWSLSLASYPDFLQIFSPQGFFSRFFLASVQTAFALLAVAQLY